MTPANIIQGLWIGPELSVMEQLSIRSFLAHGHDYHLYTYGPVAKVPQRAVVKDANEIIPADRIFRYPDTASLAGFSNFFRYTLLRERGNWWADLDIVCLRRFDFAQLPVIASEWAAGGCRYPTSGVLGFEPGHPAMALAAKICDLKEPLALVHGETGPALVEWLVRKLSLEPFVADPEVFCPIPCNRFESIIGAGVSLPKEAYSVHLWNELWSRAGDEKNRRYPAGCLYEQLKASYLDSHGG